MGICRKCELCGEAYEIGPSMAGCPNCRKRFEQEDKRRREQPLRDQLLLAILPVAPGLFSDRIDVAEVAIDRAFSRVDRIMREREKRMKGNE